MSLKGFWLNGCPCIELQVSTKDQSNPSRFNLSGLHLPRTERSLFLHGDI